MRTARWNLSLAPAQRPDLDDDAGSGTFRGVSVLLGGQQSRECPWGELMEQTTQFEIFIFARAYLGLVRFGTMLLGDADRGEDLVQQPR